MGWHKIEHQGRIMWEDPSGQRVSDPADIPGNQTRSSGPKIVFALSWPTFIAGMITGIVIGFVAGYLY